MRAHKKGDGEQALAHYDERLQQAPECLDAWMNSGALHARAGRAAQARTAFERAAVLAPHNARVQRDIGLGLFTIGQLADAARALERSVDCDPTLVGSWLHLARIRLETTDRQSAIDAARRATDLHPEDPSARFLLARCLFDSDDPELALTALKPPNDVPHVHSEAAVFRSLLAQHAQLGGLPKQNAHAPSDPDEFAELGEAYPDATHLIDMARYVLRSMPGARLLSSTRQTLEFAHLHAPEHGSVVELGVFHGVSLRWLAQWRPGGDVHGFDSFEGLPSEWARVPRGRFTTAGRPPRDIEAQLWIGAFHECLPEFVKRQRGPIALLHVDSDLYESARCGLELLEPLLRPGSVIVFDEYFGHRNWRQDEFRAFQEAVVAHGWNYVYLAANPFTGQVVVQLRESARARDSFE